jgi:multidrug resistance efflux pump
MLPLNRINTKDEMRAVRAEVSKADYLKDHQRTKLKMIELEQDQNQSRLKALKEAEKNLELNAYRLKKEDEAAELKRTTLLQINVIG